MFLTQMWISTTQPALSYITTTLIFMLTNGCCREYYFQVHSPASRCNEGITQWLKAKLCYMAKTPLKRHIQSCKPNPWKTEAEDSGSLAIQWAQGQQGSMRSCFKTKYFLPIKSTLKWKCSTISSNDCKNVVNKDHKIGSFSFSARIVC